MARASGCSESASTAAARRSRSSRRRRRGRDVGDDRAAPRQRAGLVEDDDIELTRTLQREPILDQQPVAGAERGRDGDDQRDGKAQGMGAGDDEHRRRADERLLRVAQQPPDDEGDRCPRRARRRTAAPRRGPRAPGRASPTPGPRHQAHDPRQRRRVTDGGRRGRAGCRPRRPCPRRRCRRAPWRPAATRR